MQDDRVNNKTDVSPMHKVGAAVAVFYVVALLLNAEGLQRNAQRMPYGRQRAFCVAITTPVAALARRLGITKLRSGIERMMAKTTKGVSE